MKGLNARIKGVHKANERWWGKVGNQKIFWKIDWLQVDWLIGSGTQGGTSKWEYMSIVVQQWLRTNITDRVHVDRL